MPQGQKTILQPPLYPCKSHQVSDHCLELKKMTDTPSLAVDIAEKQPVNRKKTF
jgi:hypothetical protein